MSERRPYLRHGLQPQRVDTDHFHEEPGCNSALPPFLSLSHEPLIEGGRSNAGTLAG